MDERITPCRDCGQTVRYGTPTCPWCGARLFWTYAYTPWLPEPEPKSPVEPMLPFVFALFGSILLIAAAVAFIGERFLSK
jgi:hypothetical protein